ncbi:MULTISPECIES: pectin acetylesterase-family hydrolase [unclassified Pseudomonas]|uniref:pectin acetylesterase-family hydrolase n=1 Tax=unclassified Pseudomonas TaxID=196821 RepID=UPI00244D40A5|nr:MULTISPECIES: pectin acetylesterase-family hydrolase [unclassified Pseudomonas]MDG9923354.1 pectinacetylesterase family protein [Pseudomonas sp. GD04045]MDH0037545.1 pectinacetylesterase family protein [Pseudomonas sp. GD04019]
MKSALLTCCLCVMALLTAPAHAELGDYSVWKTLLNLTMPPPADNKVTPEQGLGPYPLLNNPGGFNSGFKPGNYYGWQTVQLAPQTGAVCGNGSPYKFFVNRVPNTTNTIIYLEGGGACWDYASCTGQSGIRGARNPDGIPNDYMSLLNPGASLVSPLVVRLHPWTRTKPQNWNMIYVPYCTGDIYSGDKVAVYDDPQNQKPPLIWHHNGLRNTRAVVAWLKNNLPRPAQLLTTGCSAGGAGSLTNYVNIRQDMAPTRGFLLDDSGPVFSAPPGSDIAQYPSRPLQDHIRAVWGLNEGTVPYLQSRLPGLDGADLGSLYSALSANLPGDRLGHTHFWQDLNYSSYSYERFHPDIINAPDAATKEALIHAKWAVDTDRLRNQLSNLSNFGGYFPQYRAVNESHCTSIIEFANSDVQEQNLQLDHFVNNLLEGSGAVLSASESSDAADKAKPFNLLYYILDQLL